jgi:hypothetical protein
VVAIKKPLNGYTTIRTLAPGLKPGENEMKTFSGKNSIQNRSEATARKREDVVSLKSQQPTLWRAVASLLF